MEHIPHQKVAITEYISEQWHWGGHCSSFCPTDHGKTLLLCQILPLNESATEKHLVFFYLHLKKQIEKTKPARFCLQRRKLTYNPIIFYMALIFFKW